nr:DNA-directed DNA polymerase [Tanacetum cinerariifolium]
MMDLKFQPSPSFLPKVVENEPQATKDTITPPNNESTEDIQPLVVQTETPIIQIFKPVSEPIIAPVNAPKPNPKSSIPYPSRRNDERNREKANNQIEKFHQIFKDMSFKISFADALILMPKYASTLKALIENKEKLSEMARTMLNEHFSAVLLKKLLEKLRDTGKFLIPCDFPGMDECLALADLDASINLMPLYVWKRLSLPELTLTYFDANPRVPLILERSFLKTERALIEVFKGELTLRVGKEAITFNLDQTSRYSANYNDMTANRIDVIDMACKEYSQEVLGFFDMIASGNFTPYYDPIVSTTSPTLTPFGNNEPPEVKLKDLPPHLEYAFLEGDNKLLVIIAKDLSVEEKTTLITILKSHKRAIAWKLFDIKGIDPEFCTHKILMEEDFEPVVQHQRRVNPKIYDVIKQEVLKLLDTGLIYPTTYSPWDQEKTTFTYPYETFSYRRMPFGLCNAPGTFKRCMMAIFHDMIEKTIEVFMDDFSVFGNSFQSCLSHLEKMLKRCEDTNICLNWEKSHFMVKEGIFIGHEISKEGIKVDKAKVDVITKLPHPITVKGENCASWSNKLDDALWAFRTAYKTPIGCTTYKLVYGKACHLPIKLEHKAYWALKHANFNLQTAGDHRNVQLNELRDQAYENSLIYMEKTKRLHDSKIKNRVFNIGDRIFSGKLKSRWSGPFTISHVFPYGTVELSQPDGPNFKINGHRLKHYFKEDVPKMVVPDLQTFPKDH